MRNLFLSVMTIMAACAMPLLAPQTSSAQSAPEPAIVISMAPLGEQLDDLKHLVNASGYGDLNFMIQSQVKYYTGGIDRKKPSGALLYFEGENPKPKWLGMIAVEDPDKVLDQIANFADIDEGGDFIKITPDSGMEFLIKESGGYFIISDDETMFDIAPQDPTKTLTEAVGDFNFAFKIFGQRVPQELRDRGIELISEGFEEQMDEMEQLDESVMEAQLSQIKSLINETDVVTAGYRIDKASKLLTAHFSLTALKGSEIAKRVSVMAMPGESLFTGFLSDKAAVDSNLRYQLHQDDVNLYVSLIDNLRDQMIGELDADGEFTDQELATIKTAAADIGDCLKATLEGKSVDSGGLLMMDETSFNFAAGSTFAETKKLEDAVKSLVDLAEEKADGNIEVKLNSGTYEDITFHTVLVNIPDGEEEVQKVVGSQLKLILGVSPGKIYVAGGQDPLATLTNAIERSKTPKPSKLGQLFYNVRVAPMLRFASKVAGEEALADMAATLEKNDTGRISIWSKPITNGIETNIEIQDGILALIKEGVDAYQQGAFQGNDAIDEF